MTRFVCIRFHFIYNKYIVNFNNSNLPIFYNFWITINKFWKWFLNCKKLSEKKYSIHQMNYGCFEPLHVHVTKNHSVIKNSNDYILPLLKCIVLYISSEQMNRTQFLKTIAVNNVIKLASNLNQSLSVNMQNFRFMAEVILHRFDNAGYRLFGHRQTISWPSRDYLIILINIWCLFKGFVQ